MTDIEIIDADLADPRHQRGVVDLIDGYARGPAAGAKALSQSARERLIPELRKQTSRLILLAVIEGEPVGVAVCFDGFSTFMARPLLNVHDLAVHPEFQNHGVGTRLLAEVERRARDRGCCRMTLEVLARNTGARKLYRRLGFAGEDVAGEATFFLTKTL